MGSPDENVARTSRVRYAADASGAFIYMTVRLGVVPARETGMSEMIEDSQLTIEPADMAVTLDGRELRARTLEEAAMIVEGQRPGTTLDEAAAALRRIAQALREREGAIAL